MPPAGPNKQYGIELEDTPQTQQSLKEALDTLIQAIDAATAALESLLAFGTVPIKTEGTTVTPDDVLLYRPPAERVTPKKSRKKPR